jgi:hypothetical protein
VLGHGFHPWKPGKFRPGEVCGKKGGKGEAGRGSMRAPLFGALEESLRAAGGDTKLIDAQATETRALPAPVEEAAETAIRPRERKLRKRKVPSPPGV